MPQPSPLLNLPETRPDRWSLLSQLIGDWYRPLTPSDGYSDEDLRHCSERLSTSIPAAMREWYVLAGRRDDVWSEQDSLLPPAKLFCEDGVLHFCVENQSVTCWGVRTDDISHDDPPVVVHDEHEAWIVQSPRLSEFVLHLFAFVVQFGAHIAHIHGYAHPPCVQRVVSTLPALGFPEFVWGHIRLFGFRDLIVSVDCTNHISASGWSGQALAPFRRMIEGGDFELLYETDGTSVNDA